MKYELEKEPICPHCNEEMNISENELYFLYDSEDNHEMECPHCEKSLWVKPDCTWRFSTVQTEEDLDFI